MLTVEGTELKRCARCHITRFCSTDCQRKDWGFYKFACSVVAKRASTKVIVNITFFLVYIYSGFYCVNFICDFFSEGLCDSEE